jgi:hypothetical protein
MIKENVLGSEYINVPAKHHYQLMHISLRDNFYMRSRHCPNKASDIPSRNSSPISKTEEQNSEQR